MVVCELDKSVPSVNENDIAMIFFDLSKEDGDSAIARPVLQSIPKSYNISDPYVQMLNGIPE